MINTLAITNSTNQNMKYYFSFLLITIFLVNHMQAQQPKNRKSIKTTRVAKAPTIDGVLDDEAWKNAEIAKDFVMLRPDNGKPEVNTHKTEVKVIYDDNAIYIGAYMYDPEPSKIPMEFTNRDNFGQTDFFLVTINPNDDGQNPFEFIVMSTGSQAEAKVSEGNEDFAWNAVWDSDVKVTDKGWVVEMKIPYRALRFANREVQSWGFNFHRRVQNLNAQYTWTHIDNTKGIWTQYDGLVEDFRNIEPPTRLAFYPYASVTSDSFDGSTENSYSVGMDLKYGLTENFTLDATLIPDFGQTGFDNVSLNLGPFEQVFNEQRQFFTEGTELFNKAGLFFSRRIGNAPVGRGDVEGGLAANEEIVDNPGDVKMLNAIKVSGRTKKGLGIGFFNAITEKTEATIRNTQTDAVRKVTTEPFTNYNVLVLDQTFNQNSSVTLTNTNVTRNGRFRDANVTGLSYHIRTKDSKYFVDGSYNFSSVSNNGTTTNGSTFDMSFAKAAGNWRWEAGYNFEDDKYDPNDLGILFNNNSQTFYGNASYRILKPKGNFNNWRVNTWWNLNYLYAPGVYTGNNVGIGSWAETKSRISFGGNVNGNIGRQFDYFEARQDISELAFFTRPTRITTNGWIDSDRRKKFSVNANGWRSMYLNNPRSAFGFNIRPRFRFSNQFSVSYGFSFNKNYNEEGYTDEVNDDPIFGRRDRKTFNNTISAKYSFSIKSSLSLTFRHNWTDVRYQSQFYDLGADGYLIPNATYTENRDINFNSWNLDLNYIWQFAPGSQLIAFYRNSIFSVNENTGQDFFTNLDNLFSEPKQHIFSLRLVYFIDYNNIKNIF
jgi:hypothetical protein